jgi:hypothetical protein
VYLPVRKWLWVVALDIVLRAAFFFLTSANVLLIYYIALPVSFIHLIVLISISSYVATFELRARAAFTVIAAAATALFLSVYLPYVIWPFVRGSVTACVNNQCGWINGTITLHGIKQLAVQTLLQILINALSFALACILYARLGRARHVLPSNGIQG